MVLEAILFNRAVVFLALSAFSHGILEEHDTTSMLQTQHLLSSTKKSLEVNRALVGNASLIDEASHLVQENQAIIEGAVHVDEETSDKMAENAEEHTIVADKTPPGGTPPGCPTLYEMGVWGMIVLSVITNLGLLLGAWYAGLLKITEANFKLYTVVVGVMAASYVVWQGLGAIPSMIVLIALVHAHYNIKKSNGTLILAWPLTLACLLVSVFYTIEATYDLYWLYDVYCAAGCFWWLAAAVAGYFLIVHIQKGGDDKRI